MARMKCKKCGGDIMFAAAESCLTTGYIDEEGNEIYDETIEIQRGEGGLRGGYYEKKCDECGDVIEYNRYR